MTNLDHLFCGPCPSPSCQRMVAGQKEGYLQLYPLQAAVMAVGPLVLFPGLIVESWQGVSIEPLKPRSLSSKLGVNKTMSPLGRPGPRSDPLLGRSSQTNSVPLHPQQRTASMHLPPCCVKSLLQKAHLILLLRFSTTSWIAQKLQTA